jgi:hypothetical protein
MTKRLMFVASDGSWGDATGLLLFDATDFDSNDVIEIGNDPNPAFAIEKIAGQRGTDPLTWAWMTDDEAWQVINSLDVAITLLTTRGDMGLAEQIGDVRDVIARCGVEVAA